MPMQAISMQMVMNQSNSGGHHTAMLSEQAQQNDAMAEHCKMQMHHGKQTQQKTAYYCSGSNCSVICAGLVLSTSLTTITISPTVTDFTSFVTPNFHSQAPDFLERPPRNFS